MDLVDLVGIEPTTSSMPWKRAPSCATGPRLAEQLFYCLSLGRASQTARSSLWGCRRPARERDWRSIASARCALPVLAETRIDGSWAASLFNRPGEDVHVSQKTQANQQGNRAAK